MARPNRGDVVERIVIEQFKAQEKLELVIFKDCTVVNVMVPVRPKEAQSGWLVSDSYEIPGKALTVSEAIDYVQVMKRLTDADA
jgi:hypothetical protein